MTIRTKEPDIPTEFPPAQLFLDDIEEIVRTLVDGIKESDPEAKTTVTFSIKDQECDEVEELPKIAKKSTELVIRVDLETAAGIHLIFYRSSSTSVMPFALTQEGHLRLYHKLAAVFKRRNLWLRTLVWAHYAFFIGMVSGLSLASIAALVFSFWKHVPLWRATVAGLILVPLIITLWRTLYSHSVVIMRRSSEPSAFRQELLQKLPVAAISALLTFILTMLGVYLKHRYLR